jgi:Ca2+-binding RTX toxin-like protein
MAADLAQLRGDLAGEAFKFTLTDLALRLHYAQGVDHEESNASGVFQAAFTSLSGGIQITRDAAYLEWTGAGFTHLEDALRGQYAGLALQSLSRVERFSLANAPDMIATTPNDARKDLMVGGSGRDVLLGGGGDDLLLGRAGNDWLHGGAGDDTLDGGEGADHLEGGLGDDTYRLRANEGLDTIHDSDGQGRIYLDDLLLTGGVRIGDNLWKSADGLHTYHLASDTLTINASLRIEDFNPGDLGIHLTAAPAASFTAQATLSNQADVYWSGRDRRRHPGCGTDGCS